MFSLLQREVFAGAAFGSQPRSLSGCSVGSLTLSFTPSGNQMLREAIRHRETGKDTDMAGEHPPYIPSEGSCRGSVSWATTLRGYFHRALGWGRSPPGGARAPRMHRCPTQRPHRASVSFDPYRQGGPGNNHTSEWLRLSRWCVGEGRGHLTGDWWE